VNGKTRLILHGVHATRFRLEDALPTPEAHCLLGARVMGWSAKDSGALVSPVTVGSSLGCKFDGDDVGCHGQRLSFGGVSGAQRVAGIAVRLDRADGFSCEYNG